MSKQSNFYPEGTFRILIPLLSFCILLACGPEPAGSNKTESSSGGQLTVGISSWPGFAPGLWVNGGLEPNDSSAFTLEQGVSVKFKLYETNEELLDAITDGEVDISGLDWAFFLRNQKEGKAREMNAFMQMDWSRGYESLVSSRDFSMVNQLADEKVAIQSGPDAEWALYSILQTAGLSLDDVQLDRFSKQSEIVEGMQNGTIGAALLLYPHWQQALDRNNSLHALIGTDILTHMIAHVFIVKNEVWDKKQQELIAFYKGWLTAAANMNNYRDDKQAAARVFAKFTGRPPDEVFEITQLLRYATHGDNLNFIARNVGYEGATAEIPARLTELYGKSTSGPEYRLTSWKNLVNVEVIMDTELYYKIQEGEGDRNFRAIDATDLEAMSSRAFYLDYPEDGQEWSSAAVELVREQMIPLVQLAGLARIRIVTHSTNGSAASARQLEAERRAELLKALLSTRFKMDPDRFDLAPAGGTAPAAGCQNSNSPECEKKNNRTEIQILPLR